MTQFVTVLRAGPTLSIQDLGRPGYMVNGLSRGGAADRIAMVEGAVLLGQDIALAALEMAGSGGDFEISKDTRIALTGAPMMAAVDDQPLAWNAVHLIMAGQRIKIGAPKKGFFGYLHFAGGIMNEPVLNSRSRHIAAGIGKSITAGVHLPLGTDRQPNASPLRLPLADRFSGGNIRISPSAQTNRFTEKVRARFEDTTFTRSARGNRQGVKLDFDGAAFSADGQLSILSEIMLPGDIQMTGDGKPFVLLPECQTTGGYPRIGTVLPQDFPTIAQAAPGTSLQFRFVSVEKALQSNLSLEQIQSDLKRQLQPLIRDPHDIHDLLGYQLISGVTAGREPVEEGNTND